MFYKRALAILMAVIALFITSCGAEPETGTMQQKDNQTVSASDPTPEPDLLMIQPDTQVVNVISQEKTPLPDAGRLSTFPGVLHCMSLTLEEIISILGRDFELYENSAQGYDVYQFSDYQLVLEYDSMRNKLSTIWLEGVPYYVYAGAIRNQDLDNDGKAEYAAAYEDDQLNGRVTVFTPEGVIMADQTTGYFGEKCDLSFLTGYGSGQESLIVLDTGNEQDCEVFAYTAGKLISMIPPDEKNISAMANVDIAGDSVLFSIPDEGLSYDCPIPGFLRQALEADSGVLPDYRFSKNVKPLEKDGILSLEIRQSLQLKLFEDPSQVEQASAWVDTAQVVFEYKYLGDGKWKLASKRGGAKYDRDNLPNGLTAADFQLGEAALLAPAEEAASKLNLDLSPYTSYDLQSGVLMEHEGLYIGITSEKVSYLSLERDNGIATSRGLSVMATRQEALALYGLPDRGYAEDSVWTYYRLRDETEGSEVYPVVDSLILEFEGDRVSKIGMAMYVSVY